MAKNELRISGSTRIAGVVGYPITHTLSPAMHNAAFAAKGIEAVYVPFSVQPQGLGRLVKTLADLGALGLNVTIPYKQRVISFLDEITPGAEGIGAVNTVEFRDGRLIGHNTDGLGFLASLKGVFKPRKQRAVLIGAGGAGRAVAVSLIGAGVSALTIIEPNASQRNGLLAHLRKLGYTQATGLVPGAPELAEELTGVGLLVNASPLGLKPNDPLPLQEELMPANICVMDLVYGHGPTRFLQTAKRRGCQVIPGWHMLLYQGAEAFRIWTRQTPPVDVMRRALIQAGV